MAAVSTEPVTAARVLSGDRSSATREALLQAAERLFAERGMYAVSNRQISEAAGSGKQRRGLLPLRHADRPAARDRKQAPRADRGIARRRCSTGIGDSTELRDWVGTLVRPLTDHLAALGNPSWYARFAAQAMADPTYRHVVTKDALTSPHARADDRRASTAAFPTFPSGSRSERIVMARNLLMHTCAEHEGALAEHGPRSRSAWPIAAEGLIDAIVGLWRARSSERRSP